jgi:hypothetical protein
VERRPQRGSTSAQFEYFARKSLPTAEHGIETQKRIVITTLPLVKQLPATDDKFGFMVHRRSDNEDSHKLGRHSIPVKAVVFVSELPQGVLLHHEDGFSPQGVR